MAHDTSSRPVPTGQKHGSVPWYVPEGAEFDSNVELVSTNRRFAQDLLHHGRNAEMNPWNHGKEWVTTLEDFDICARDIGPHWDEVEEWDDGVPPRPTIYTVHTEFADLDILRGIWREPTPAELKAIEKLEADEVRWHYEMRMQAEAKARRQAKAEVRAAKRAKRERAAARRRKDIAARAGGLMPPDARAVTVPRTLLLKDLFG